MSVLPIPQTFSQIVEQTTTALSFPYRLFGSVRTLFQIDPRKAAFTMMALVASTLYVLAADFFLLKGVYHSWGEISSCKEEKKLLCMAPLGNAGGWTTEVLLDLMLLRSFYLYVIQEGEFFQTQALLHTHSPVEEESTMHLEIANEARFFPSTLSSLYPSIASPPSPSFLESLKKAPTLSLVSVGTLLPLFVFNVLCSIGGEIGLGANILKEGKELSETGHLGEWPLNAAAATALAITLLRGVANEGLFAITKKTYEEYLQALNDPTLYTRMREMGHKELAAIACRCLTRQSPVLFPQLEAIRV